MDDAGAPWAELPREIWSEVGKRLPNYIDALRFRSVCPLWRSSLPRFREPSPPLRLPFPGTIAAGNLFSHVYISKSIIYRLAPEPSPSVSSSSSHHRNGRLVMLEKLESNMIRLLHPLSRHQYGYSFQSDQDEHKNLNLLDLRFDEIATSYSLKLSNDYCAPGMARVAVAIPNSTVIAVYEGGKLGFFKFGDERWNLIDEQNFHYDDVIVYNRHNYAIDRFGTVFSIDSSMTLVQFSPPLDGPGHKKHLVECGGELLVIDLFRDNVRSRATHFKAYKLDQECGRCVEMNNLGNQSIILGNDCYFSLEASEFEGCIQNCIYFSDANGVGSSICVFDLEGGRIGKISAHPGILGIFSPPPIWSSPSNTFILP